MNNVYLFQVNYTVKIAGSDSLWLPYSTGCLAATAKSMPDINDYYTFGPELFCKREDPQEVMKRIDNPVIVGFSNYVWNTEWNRVMSRVIKEAYPECIVVFGGPNVWDGYIEQEGNSHIDVILKNEGEFAFLELLRKNIDGEKIPAYMTGERIHDLGALPDPFSTGEFDWLVENYPNNTWNGTFETARGCPFLCTFCDWGSLTYAKVKKFELERVEANMKWMSENKVTYILCADANVGIFKQRDIEIAHILRKYADAPGSLIDAINLQYNKNNTDICLDIAAILGPYSRGITFAVQSMSESVLEAIKRKNMAMNKLSALIKGANKRNLTSYTELILPMPEETLESWKDGISFILEAGQHNAIMVWNAQVLQNSEMNDPEYIEQYGIQKTTAYDYINYGNSNDWSGAEEEIEIICATNTMTSEEVIEGWMYYIIIREFHINGVTQILARYCNGKHNIPYRKFYETYFDRLKTVKDLKEILDFVGYVEYTYLTEGRQPTDQEIKFRIPEIYGSKAGTLPPQHFMKDILHGHVWDNIDTYRQLGLDMVKEDFNIDLPEDVKIFNNGYTYNKDMKYPQTVSFDYNIMDDEHQQTEYSFIPRWLSTELGDKMKNKSEVLLFKHGIYKSEITYTAEEQTNKIEVYQYGTEHPTDVGHKDEKII